MTTVQQELRGIHNRINTLEQSLEQLDKEVGEVDYFAKSNIAAFHLYMTRQYSFPSSTDATSKQKAERK